MSFVYVYQYGLELWTDRRQQNNKMQVMYEASAGNMDFPYMQTMYSIDFCIEIGLIVG